MTTLSWRLVDVVATHGRVRASRPVRAALLAFVVLGGVQPAPLQAQIKAQARPAPTPPWTKGILPISPESYYNAIECGKQGVDDPPCVFWDTGLCKNDDFELAWYTPYKQVAYEVWVAVRRKQPAPQPNYQAAQRTRVTIGVTPVKGAKNTLKELVVKRAGKPAVPVDRSVSGGGGRFTFDTALFAATADVTLELVGGERTLSCVVPQAVLRQLRLRRKPRRATRTGRCSRARPESHALLSTDRGDLPTNPQPYHREFDGP